MARQILTTSPPPLRRETSPIQPAVVKLLVLLTAQLPLLHASPLQFLARAEKPEPIPAENPTLWIYLAIAVALVLLGGAFAGLTIALMGQDEIYLQVIKTSGEGAERKHATAVLGLLNRGKHWVLVTLLLGNVITNETLPIVLDRSLGGGWPAVLGSTVLIVIFGEIIPQSICVRYGLPIGAWMSPLVLVLMYILAPVAWPTAKLLDRLLGEDHGTVYKKAGLKTLVTLHKSLGQAGEQLNQDEVTIISAVLDLKAKSVGSIMTPMDDVFTMSADTVLDEKTMEIILSAGYSRIPIYAADNEENFVGMLLVKILITYDPEDCKRVRDFALATLPETRLETSCLDIVNFFQEGKSHMVLVSEYPGDNQGALGVVTLEDVIEELIGEEIIDESDVFIDVHKAIRRMTPAPKYRVPKGEIVTEPEEHLINIANSPAEHAEADPATVNGDLATSPKKTASSTYLRRSSSAQHTSDREGNLRKSMTREHLKHLGPSNRASRPRQTRYNTVKIKPGAGSLVESAMADSKRGSVATPANYPPEGRSREGSSAAQGGIGAGLLGSGGKEAKDGVLALQQGYGTITPSAPPGIDGASDVDHADTPKSPQKDTLAPLAQRSPHAEQNSDSMSRSYHHPYSHGAGSPTLRPSRAALNTASAAARSGSITENIVDSGGIRKTVLELTSSGSDEHDAGAGAAPVESGVGEDESKGVGGGQRKKRSKKKKKRAGENGSTEGEHESLL